MLLALGGWYEEDAAQPPAEQMAVTRQAAAPCPWSRGSVIPAHPIPCDPLPVEAEPGGADRGGECKREENREKGRRSLVGSLDHHCQSG